MKPSNLCRLQMSPMFGAFEYAMMIRCRGSPNEERSFLNCESSSRSSGRVGLFGWYGRCRNSMSLLLLLLFWSFWFVVGRGFGSDEVATFCKA